MGNTSSNVTSGVKKQADAGSVAIYKLVDLKGCGELVNIMKEAMKNKTSMTSVLLDEKIKELVTPFLYNEGRGTVLPISELVIQRNRDSGRVKQLQPPAADKNSGDKDKSKKNPPPPPVQVQLNEKSPDGTNRTTDAAIDNGDVNLINKLDPNTHRFVCWRLDERGAVGETVLHLCLLNASTVLADLAKRLIKLYPMLIYDYYVSDEYYGESALHIAIVNEDLPMVKFMLDNNSDYHCRCNGSFFSPEDQKSSREDTLDHEWVRVCFDTNYEGYVYWGEYPLSFAACLGQEECYRLTLAKGADPDLQDTNGNTVLHMLVIHEKKDMFNMAYELGASMDIRNMQHLLPLTLAAKLARKEMFFHILKLEREVYWQIGGIVCVAYPLQDIDTIDTSTGEINNVSALNLIVYGEKEGHLDMMDRMVVDLLHAKWNSFVKFRFYKSFAMFCTYFLFSITCFVLRPGPFEVDPALQPAPPVKTEDPVVVIHSNNDTGGGGDSIVNATINVNTSVAAASVVISGTITQRQLFAIANGTGAASSNGTTTTDNNDNLTDNNSTILTNITPSSISNVSDVVATTLTPNNNNVTPTPSSPAPGKSMVEDMMSCYLVPSTSSTIGLIRWVAETGTLLGAIWYLSVAGKEASFLGYHLFSENMKTVPSRILFIFSCSMVVLMIPLRLSCASEIEDVVAVLVMLSTAPYFLFFCRGFKIVGPFVVMVYKMIMGDLLRFVAIYLVFVLGFSQAFFVLFRSHHKENGDDDNYFRDPTESVMAMFIMSMAEFTDMYAEFENTNYPLVAKILFILYMGLVAILLINMLIAMMGNTYQIIAETKNEWQRQWARIVLVVERGVGPSERLENQLLYSQEMADKRRAFVVRIQMGEQKKEIETINRIKLLHNKNSMRRAKGSCVMGTPHSSPQRVNSSSDPGGSNPSLL